MKFDLLKEQYTENIVNGNMKRLDDNAENLMKVFIDAVINNSIPEVWNVFKDEPKKFEALSNFLEINEDQDKQRIYYFAVMKTIIDLNRELNDKLLAQVEVKEYEKYKYIFPILDLLSSNMILSQGKIADKLKISSNSLSNFFRRTNHFGLWNVEKRGKNQYYVISLKGKQTFVQFNKQNIVKIEENFDKCIISLLELISDELQNRVPNVNNVIQKMNDAYGKGASLFSSPIIKLKLKTLFIKSEIGNKNRRNYFEEFEKNYFFEEKATETFIYYQASSAYQEEYDDFECCNTMYSEVFK